MQESHTRGLLGQDLSICAIHTILAPHLYDATTVHILHTHKEQHPPSLVQLMTIHSQDLSYVLITQETSPFSFWLKLIPKRVYYLTSC